MFKPVVSFALRSTRRQAVFWAGLLVVLAACVSQSASAQLSVIGGNIVTNITSGVAGGQPVPVSNSTTSLSYKRQNIITKITVSTVCPSQRFNLSVVAISVTSGTADPAVSLVNGMLAADFISNIPPKPPGVSQTATLQYTASATFAQGTSVELGNDVHTVTYTLAVQ